MNSDQDKMLLHYGCAAYRLGQTSMPDAVKLIYAITDIKALAYDMLKSAQKSKGIVSRIILLTLVSKMHKVRHIATQMQSPEIDKECKGFYMHTISIIGNCTKSNGAFSASDCSNINKGCNRFISVIKDLQQIP